jgi:RimJ/RimL family protein N-acetyltransferase
VISGDLGSLTAWRQPQGGHTLPPDFFADQTYGLQQFHLGLCRGAVAGILWFAGPGEATTISNWRLARGEIEVRNVRTLSEFQRQGLFHCMARTALRSARAQGVTAAYAHVDEHNVASRNAFMALGFHPTHRLKMLRVLGVDRIRESVLEP